MAREDAAMKEYGVRKRTVRQWKELAERLGVTVDHLLQAGLKEFVRLDSSSVLEILNAVKSKE